MYAPDNMSVISGNDMSFETLMLKELRGIRIALEDRAKKEAEEKRVTDASFSRANLIGIIKSNMVVSIFGGALTLPILSAESNDLGKRLVTASFLFFGTNTISCLFWLLRVTLPDEADLTDELSGVEKILLVLIGTIGHTMFNVAGLILLAATAVTYTPSFNLGIICVAVMSATAIFYSLCGYRHIARIPWSQLRT